MSAPDDRPDLRPFWPALADLPQHRMRRLVVRPLDSMEPRTRYRVTLSPWVLSAPGLWWSYERRLIYRREKRLLARVYLNGGGRDHELRFSVIHPVARTTFTCQDCGGTGRVKRMPRLARASILGGELPGEVPDAEGLLPCDNSDCRRGRVEGKWGAANSFLFVTPELVAHFRDVYLNRNIRNQGPRRYGLGSGSLGSRGLAAPTPEDVVHVARWCDERIDGILREIVFPGRMP